MVALPRISCPHTCQFKQERLRCCLRMTGGREGREERKETTQYTLLKKRQISSVKKCATSSACAFISQRKHTACSRIRNGKEGGREAPSFYHGGHEEGRISTRSKTAIQAVKKAEQSAASVEKHVGETDSTTNHAVSKRRLSFLLERRKAPIDGYLMS